MSKMYLDGGYGANGKGNQMMSRVDMFELARPAEVKYELEGKLADEQRLLDNKHIDEIAQDIIDGNVMGFWFPIIGFDETVKIQHDDDGRAYIEIPDDEEELKEFSKHIHFIDGQHRVWAFTKKEVRAALDSFFVCACILINPTKAEMIKAFIELNGKGKTMDKNLLLDFNAKIGALEKDVQEAYDLLSMLDNDKESPLYQRVDWGNRGKKRGNYKAKTLVELTVGSTKKKRETDGFIVKMNKLGYNSIEAKYKILLNHLKQALTIENTADSTLGDPKVRKLNNQQMAYILRMCAESVELIKAEGYQQVTSNRLAAAYKYIVKESLGQDHIYDSDYCPMRVIEGKDKISEETYNRWGGRANVNKAFTHDFRWVRIRHNELVKTGGKVVAR